MSGKKDIVSIAQLGLAWGLKEIRALLSSRPELKQDVKVVFMKLETLQRNTITRLTSSLSSKINPDAVFTNKDSPTKKLEAIFVDFNIEPEYQEGIFVACNGKGDINKQLQNNLTLFTTAEQIATNVVLDENNYVVYIDSDVKQALINILPSMSESERVAEVINLENLEANAPSDRDPNERFTLLLASSKKLRSVITNFASVEETAVKAKYLGQIEKLLDSHLISLTRAEESYNELRDDQLIEKQALEKKFQNIQSHENDLIAEMEEREKIHAEEIAEKDEKQTELNNQLKELLELKTEKIDNQSDHEAEITQLQGSIEALKTEIAKLNNDFGNQKASHQRLIQDLEDEKTELATNLEKKTQALRRLENLHEKINIEATNVQNQLEQNEVTPGKMVQRRVTSEVAEPPTIQLRKKTTFQDKSNSSLANSQSKIKI